MAYDGSGPANKALTGARWIWPRKYGAELHVLTVARPPEFGDDVETEAVIENARRKHCRKVLDALVHDQAEPPVSQPSSRWPWASGRADHPARRGAGRGSDRDGTSRHRAAVALADRPRRHAR
ncbi:MAG: universal stress protein [Chromatiales bacterium]|nr:universal stress protein [Chromatiales bacterium]